MNAKQTASAAFLSPEDTERPSRVSAHSNWTDTRWKFDTTTKGQHTSESEIEWNFVVGEGRFFDPRWASVLEAFRWILWSRLRTPYGGRRMKETSILIFSVGVRSIVRWMDKQEITDLGRLSPAVCQDYVEDCIEQQLIEGDGKFTCAFLYRKLQIVELIHIYTPILKRRGLQGIESWPFGSDSASSISRKHATKKTGKTGPLPDLLAITLMNRALKLIGEPAKDVIALHEALLAAREAPIHRKLLRRPGTRPRNEAMRLAALDFTFSTLAGEATPWHPRICGGCPTASYPQVAIEVRALIIQVISAAVITIMSQTGMRANELCALRVGSNKDAKIPGCVELRKGPSGLNEMFVVRGFLAKGQSVHESVEWVAGIRPAGSRYLPPVVVAISVLERLLAPWRVVIGSDSLLVRGTRGLVHRAHGITRPLVEHIWRDLKRFARETPMDVSSDRVAVFAENGFSLLKTTHWRFTWAHFVFKTDPRLLREISLHFKHLALQTTEYAYIGNDAELLETLDETRLAETTRFFFEATTGRRLVAGAAGFLVQEHKASLEKLVSKIPSDAGLVNIRRWVETHGLQIWFFPEGKCLINARPDQSRCHQMAGTSHWSNRMPNYAARSCELCLGCPCFSVDDEHQEYWQKRYESNRDAFQQALDQGRGAEFRVAKARADQAKAVLARISGEEK